MVRQEVEIVVRYRRTISSTEPHAALSATVRAIADRHPSQLKEFSGIEAQIISTTTKRVDDDA